MKIITQNFRNSFYTSAPFFPLNMRFRALMNEAGRERVVGHVPKIATAPLSLTVGEYNLPTLLDHLKHEGKLTKESLLSLIQHVTELMAHEPNVVRLDSPVTIVGDLHGQFFDLVHVLSIAGDSPPDRSFLFLGDYVDRGSWSVETLSYLYSMKAAHPKHVVLLRGNHESRDMNLFFNFKDECVYKYDISIFEAFTKSFQSLPLAALVHDKYICMHGGISPDLHIISQIFMIDRFNEPPLEGLFCDFLWSDPDPNPSASRTQKFRPNEARGSSFYYSNEAVMEFLENNGLYCLIRAHEVQLEGYKTGPPMKGSKIPSHITIFSAPNYCDQYGNKGAILNIESVDDFNIVQFDASPHPFCLPNFMNVFDWSIPFVAEKVTEILHAILHTGAEPWSSDDLSPRTREKILHHESSSELVSILQDHLEAPSHAGNTLRAKLKSISRLLGLMRSVRHHVPTSSSQQIEESPLERRYSQAAEADFFTENRRPSTNS